MGTTAGSAPDQGPSKRLKKGTFSVDRDTPKLDKAMDVDMKRTDKALGKVIPAIQGHCDLVAEPAGLLGRSCLGLLLKGLQFRRQLPTASRTTGRQCCHD